MPPSPRRPLAAVTVLVALAAAAPAQPPSARGVEADVRLALKDAQRLADTDRPRAVERLQQLLATLEADHALPADRRDALARVVRDRIRVVQAAAAPTPEPAPPPLPPEAAKRAEEYAKIKAGLREAVALRKQGKTAEANAKAAELAKLYPDSPAAQALTDIGQTTAGRDEARAIRTDKQQGNLAGLNSVDRAGVMPKGDLELPRDYRERTAKRKADTAPTAAELKLIQALDTPVKAEFQNSRLEDVMDYLSTMMNLTVVLDKAALDELNLNYNSPVTFVVRRPVAARSALRGVLRSLGLTYVVRDGTVFVTTPARAREYLVTKTYYLGDLVTPVGNPFFPVGNPLEEAFNVQMLIDTIVTSIDPDSWDVRGGPGTIRYYAPTKSLIVRQSAEVHVSLKASLHR